MDCPACSVPMIVVEREGIELDYCPACRGVWFDGGEVRLLEKALGLSPALSSAQPAAPGSSSERSRPCPRCRGALEKVRTGEVLIDRCPQGDGYWFDAGELGKCLAAKAAGPEVRFLGESFSSSVKK